MYVSLRSSNKGRFTFTPAQVLALGFAGLILIGSLLLWMPFVQEPGKSISYLDALFTAASSVCITGLLVVDISSQFNIIGELIVLALVQVGGLGIMTFSALMFLLMGKRLTLRDRLVIKEALGSFSIAGVVRLTRNIILTTLGIEAVGVLLFSLIFAADLPLPQALYWGLFHGVSAFNNAGIALTSNSLQPFAGSPLVLLLFGTLITMGGIGFFVLQDLWQNWRRRECLSLHTRIVLRVTFWFLIIGTLLILVLEWSNPSTLGPMPWYHKIVNAWFMALAPRSSGFETVPTGSMLDATLLVTIVLMFIGAAPGGTGGGIKITTFTLLLLVVRATASGVDEIRVMGRRLARDLVDKALTITVISLSLVLTMAGLLLVSENAALRDPTNPVAFINVLFEVVSAFGTVGLSTGMTASLSPLGRLLIAVTMFIGRVGPLTIATALAQRKKTRTPLHYPEDRVMIG